MNVQFMINSLFPNELLNVQEMQISIASTDYSELIETLYATYEPIMVINKLNYLGEHIDILKKERAHLRLLKNLQMSAIINLSHEFEKAKIRHVFIKGIAMEQLLYGQNVDRHLGDIDVYVCPSQISEATQIAFLLKYKPYKLTIDYKNTIEFVPQEDALNVLSASKHVTLRYIFSLELHRAIFNFYQWEAPDDSLFEKMYNNSTTILLKQEQVRTLDLCDTFILACLHYYGHCATEDFVKVHFAICIRYFYEIFEAVYQMEKKQLWKCVYERTHNTNMSWQIGITLEHLCELTGWQSSNATKLFVTPYVLEHKNDLISKKSFSSKWNLSIADRLLSYNFDVDVSYYINPIQLESDL